MIFKTRSLTPIRDEYNKKTSFSVCDIEATKWTNFLVIGYYDGTEFKSFINLRDFFKHCFQEMPQSIYAHFGGIYDFIFLIHHNLENPKLYEIEEIIPRGSGILTYSVTQKKTGNKITFRDSSAMLPSSLKRLTENFGVTHKKQEIDYEKITRVTPQLLEYLEYDCKGLYQCIDKYFRWPLIKYAGPSHTIASQALRVFRTTLKKPLPGITSRACDDFVRRSYFGGRVEIFKPIFQSKGKEKLNCYDVNSLFPYIMTMTPMPGKALGFTKKYYGKDKPGFYHAKAFMPDMDIPPLPVKHEGKLIFPVGTFEGYWSHIEIEYAKSLGCKFEIKKGVIFESAGFIFQKYISDLYEIKQNSEPGTVDYELSKLLMNGCYGRFGLRRDREGLEIRHKKSKGKVQREITIGTTTYELSTTDEESTSYSHVGISAMVTSAARVYMHQTFYKPYGNTIYYTDTDSIFTTKRLKTGHKLGELKLEDECDNACFLLPKTYIAGKKIRMKGFDKKKIGHFSFEDFKHGLAGDLKHLKIIQEPKFAKLKTALRINKKLLTMTKESTKSIQSKYDKRLIFIQDGQYLTRPIKLN